MENRYVADAATLVSSHAYGYNLDGHRSSDVSKVANADTAGTYLTQTASLVYTADNRLRWITKAGADAGGFEGYAYDAAGSVSCQRRGASDIWYRMDRGRLLCAGASSTDPCAAAGAASYNYDPFGRLDTVTTGDAAGGGAGDKVVERYGYDGFDRTTSHRKYDPATGGLKSSRSSVFDPLDRTVQETTQAATGPAKTTTFGYLGLSDQIVSEEQPDPGAGGAAKTTASYTYGPSGERLSQTKTPLSGAGGAAETSFYGTNAHTMSRRSRRSPERSGPPIATPGMARTTRPGSPGGTRRARRVGRRWRRTTRTGSTPNAGTRPPAATTWGSVTTPQA